ncbi:hypothetical protein [Streptomyces sp. BBFR102]
MANQYRSVGSFVGAVVLTDIRARMADQGFTFVSQWFPDGQCGG